MGSKHCNANGRIVWTAWWTMFKNKPHFVTFHKSILVSLWTFQPTVVCQEDWNNTRKCANTQLWSLLGWTGVWRSPIQSIGWLYHNLPMIVLTLFFKLLLWKTNSQLFLIILKVLEGNGWESVPLRKARLWMSWEWH